VATLKEYFQTDFANALTHFFSWKTTDETPIEIDVKVGVEVYSSAKFICYYVPQHARWLQIFQQLIVNVDDALTKSKDIQTIAAFAGDIQYGLIGSHHATFSNRVYIYSEDANNAAIIPDLDVLCRQRSIWLTVRGQEYVQRKMELEKPLAFICHDTRDKAEVAQPIAIGLIRLMCPVWYDEFSLKVGDSLRESIERGLKEARKCILILSPNFLTNRGWTKTEFNSIFTREIVEQRSVVLPVWRNVSHQEVYEYSPSLADKVAVNWDAGVEEVVRRLFNSIKA
jgi:hypothetical protein